MAMVNSLEYEDIRNSIIEFLKRDPYYKDFNFEASNMSRQINMLAYTSMYNGYYVKMLIDEAMSDSARTQTALISHANTRNYLTKFIAAAKSLINLTVDGDGVDKENTPYIQINRGQNFKGVDKNNKTVYFMNPYDVTLNYNSETDKYEGEDFLVIQGQTKTITTSVTALNKKYLINDQFCDESTVVVKIKTNKDSKNSYEYIRNHDFYDVGENDLVYYITANSNGVYQIHFGRDIFGREPKVGEVIEISFTKTLGSDANDVNKFEIVLAKKQDTPNTDINFYSGAFIATKTIEPSSGGLNAETNEELRFGIMNHSRQRGRAVTPDDIKSIIISEFRDVESINVWSGAESSVRRYGKTYISIKPKTGELLTYASKKTIEDLLVNRYGIITRTDLIFVDPNFTDILMTIKFKVNREFSSDNASVVRARIESNVTNYNKEFLSKFDANYYDSQLVSYIRANDSAVSTIYTEKLIQKSINLNYSFGKYIIKFGNQLRSIESNHFDYGQIKAYIKNVNNVLYIYNALDNNMIAVVGSVDLLTGEVDINIPQYVSAEIINLIASPVYTDIDTLEDNIVRIKTVKAEEI